MHAAIISYMPHKLIYIMLTLQGLTDTATSVSQKVKKHLPSAISGVVRHPALVFDPTKESAVAVNKRKAVKPVYLTVMAITGHTYSIPRGKHERKALKEGREQKIQITRVMTSQEVKQAILSSYQHLGIDDYEVLESERNKRLSLAKEQSPDGVSLVEGIDKGKAVLYIYPKKHSEVCSHKLFHSLLCCIYPRIVQSKNAGCI